MYDSPRERPLPFTNPPRPPIRPRPLRPLNNRNDFSPFEAQISRLIRIKSK